MIIVRKIAMKANVQVIAMWRWNLINVNMLVIFQVYGYRRGEVGSFKFASICLSLSTSVSFSLVLSCEHEHSVYNRNNWSWLIIDDEENVCANDHQIDQSSSCIRTPSSFDFTLHIQLTLVQCYIIIIRRTLRFSLYLSAGVYNTSSTAASWHDKVIGIV